MPKDRDTDPEAGLSAARDSASRESRYARLRQLFDEIVDLTAADRLARLATLTDDATLRDQVMDLVAAHDIRTSRATHISQPMADLIEGLAGPELRVGEVLGAWKLVGELGKGGMGAVFLAERNDGHFRQRSAVKLLQGVASHEALALLAKERQILATLSHPNVARLLDGGTTPKGRPYLVMEYIEGQPLDSYLREQKLSTRAALALFAGICETIASAHAHLVVHCDIKPSNIMVEKSGRVVVLDFGIAALIGSVDGSDEPTSRARAYTPRYASPELKAGEPVSTAADIYSLGIVLSEMLEDRQRQDTDLAAIIACATSAVPRARYASVPMLALDIERYLQGMPVAAREATWSYTAAKFLRRRWPLAVGVAVFIVTIGAFTWELAQERDRALKASLLAVQERDGANVARTEAESQRDRAVAAEALARQERDRTQAAEKRALSELDRALIAERNMTVAESEARRESTTTREVSDFLLSLFSAADPENAQGKATDVLTLVNRGSERIDRNLKDQPATQASMYSALAMVYQNLGQPAKSAELYDKAIAAERQVKPLRPLKLAEVLRLAGVLRSNSMQFPLADPLAREAVTLFETHAGPRSPQTAHALVTLGLVLTGKSEFKEAESTFHRAATSFAGRGLVDDQDVASTWHNLGRVYTQMGDHEKAAEFFRRSFESKARKVGERHPRYLNSFESWAKERAQLNHLDEAAAALRKARTLRREIHGDKSDQFAIAGRNLAQVLDSQGRYTEALQLFAEVGVVELANYGRRSMIYASHLWAEASVHEDRGDYAAAETACTELLEIRRELRPAGDLDVARAELMMGRILMATGRNNEALPLLTRARRTLGEKLAEEHRDVMRSGMLLADALRRSGDSAAARRELDRLAPHVARQVTLSQAEWHRVNAWLAHASGDRAEARARLENYETLLASQVPATHPRRLVAALEHAELMLALNETAAAISAARDAHARIASSADTFPMGSTIRVRLAALPQ